MLENMLPEVVIICARRSASDVQYRSTSPRGQVE